MLFPDYVILVLSIFIIAVSALQTTREDVMEAFTGSNQDLFKNKKQMGAELVLNRVMLVLGILFLIMVIWSNSLDRFFNV
ncbi:preprotein translocase subunit SecG [Acholeplasma equifetale]|uniref:preprotein translocase subunit SecG n=1 Tax=Acholeplasma equifetale TaxID=264634 RepID=UPI00068AAA57|nr:preprotein translocase subunit SecG [Acholeplasma equifetale]